MIVLSRTDKYRVVPRIFCDTCGLQIKDLGMGMISWRDYGNRDVIHGSVRHFHKGDCDLDPAAPTMEMKYFLELLAEPEKLE